MNVKSGNKGFAVKRVSCHDHAVSRFKGISSYTVIDGKTLFRPDISPPQYLEWPLERNGALPFTYIGSRLGAVTSRRRLGLELKVDRGGGLVLGLVAGKVPKQIALVGGTQREHAFERFSCLSTGAQLNRPDSTTDSIAAQHLPLTAGNLG